MTKQDLRLVELTSVTEVLIDDLTTTGSPRLGGEDLDHVDTLAEAQNPLPPIVVHGPTMRVIDGFHRLKAARLRGEEKISVVFFDGAEDDAFVLAVQSNVTHGLPLSKQDRKRAAERIIFTHPHWSDRMIASVAGIAPATVAKIRSQLQVDADVVTLDRTGQDGRVRRSDPEEGRRRAGEVIRSNPDMSLRQVAKIAGISPETARDVRKRIARGEDGLLRSQERTPPPTPPLPSEPSLFGQFTAPDRARMVARLRADPALRFSENGRAILNLLNLHTIDAGSWERILSAVPPHWTNVVATLADGCAAAWAEFADRLEDRATEPPPGGE
ncbi:ParB/RepB/Spo0J family partition protein [Herbidospora daliensis]|uniref:ParB/RepB/Spo0J family partition protein n=1 Tax=Herbidospora daliensis TaxID=295585 RepID=UPI000B25F9DA|nr:ParB N-terminal domain-containing protein [Herbidospora daliensis]